MQNGEVHIGVADSGVVLRPNVNLYDGKMHDLSVSWSSATGEAKLYIDDKLAGTAIVSPGAKIADGGTLVFGQEQDSRGGGFVADNALEGRINDIRIFSGVRSADQIASDANGIVDQTDSSKLISRYPFNEGGVVTEDFIGTNDLRLEGGVQRYTPSTADYDTTMTPLSTPANRPTMKSILPATEAIQYVTCVGWTGSIRSIALKRSSLLTENLKCVTDN